MQNSNEIKKKDENFCSSYKFDDKKDKYTTQISKEMMNNNFILESNKENNTNLSCNNDTKKRIDTLLNLVTQ